MLLFPEGICKSRNLSPTLRPLPTGQTADQLFKEQRKCVRRRGWLKYILLHDSIFTFSLSHPVLFPCRPLHFLNLLLIHLSVAEATSVVLFKRNPYDRHLLGDWGQAVGQLPE